MFKARRMDDLQFSVKLQGFPKSSPNCRWVPGPDIDFKNTFIEVAQVMEIITVY